LSIQSNDGPRLESGRNEFPRGSPKIEEPEVFFSGSFSTILLSSTLEKIQMTEEDEDDKVIGRIYAPPGYGLEFVEMMKETYRRWAAAGNPLYIEIVKQMDGDTEDQDDPNAHHGHARR
jgi:hypothetical protein